MKALRDVLLVCLIVELNSCADTAILPDLARRARNYVADLISTDVPIVNDFLLNDGWYRVTSQDVTYVMATNNTLPDIGTCGSLYVIYMLGESVTATDIPSGEEIEVEACLRSYFDLCDATYNIKVRNCEGNLQYYLKTAERLSAYCFDPPELEGQTGFSSAPTDVNLGEVSVQQPTLEFTDTNGFLIPYLQFECEFTQQDSYFYLVQWYSNGVLFHTLGPATDVSQLIMTEGMLIEKGITLGVNIQCGVSVSVDVFGIRTEMVFSNNFFIGIKFNEETISLSKTSTAYVTFKITVPIGCPHNPLLHEETNRILCNHVVQMFDRVYEGTCIGNADVIVSERCGVVIPTLLPSDDWDPNKEYSMEIRTNDKTYADATTFTLSLRTQNSGQLIWRNYQPNSVIIIVTDTVVNKHVYCYSQIDPHMTTADGIYYEQQKVGVFVLCRNEAYNIEIQEQTETCNGVATCTCGVIIRAGTDIVMFNTCGNLRYIGYTQCNDNGLLKTKRIDSHTYQVDTPIGTRILIKLHTGYYEGMMNINVGMAPKDFGNTKGLCGVFDGIKEKDLTASDGEIYNDNLNYNFSTSWQLTNDDPNNMFGVDYSSSTSWDQDNTIFCYCVEDVTAERTTNATTCSASDFDGCNVTDTNDVTERFCTVVANRRKRSISDVRNEMKRRMALASKPKKPKVSKRADVTITEDEANTICTNAIQNIAATTNFTSLMAPGETEAKIEQCIFDYIASGGEYEAVTAHVDALNLIVTQELELDPVYVANNTESIELFRQQSCPRNCSSRGTCNDGLCQCETYYHSAACSIDERDQLTIEDVTGAGLCDRLHSSCDCFNMQTDNLIPTFKFQYYKYTIDSHGNYTLVDSMSGDGEYLSIFEGRVCDDSATNDQPFVTHYNLSISNDGTTFSEHVEIHVYDSTCQQYTTDASGKYTFSLKSEYCHIAGTCYFENEANPDNACNVCQPLSSSISWTYVCTEEEDDNMSTIIIIASVVVITLIVAIVIYCTCIKAKVKTGCETLNIEMTSEQGDAVEGTSDEHLQNRPGSSMSTTTTSDVVSLFQAKPSDAVEGTSDEHLQNRPGAPTSTTTNYDVVSLFQANPSDGVVCTSDEYVLNRPGSAVSTTTKSDVVLKFQDKPVYQNNTFGQHNDDFECSSDGYVLYRPRSAVSTTTKSDVVLKFQDKPVYQNNTFGQNSSSGATGYGQPDDDPNENHIYDIPTFPPLAISDSSMETSDSRRLNDVIEQQYLSPDKFTTDRFEVLERKQTKTTGNAIFQETVPSTERWKTPESGISGKT